MSGGRREIGGRQELDVDHCNKATLIVYAYLLSPPGTHHWPLVPCPQATARGADAASVQTHSQLPLTVQKNITQVDSRMITIQNALNLLHTSLLFFLSWSTFLSASDSSFSLTPHRGGILEQHLRWQFIPQAEEWVVREEQLTCRRNLYATQMDHVNQPG